MQTNQKGRLAFLAVSGLLLSAACASWFYHVKLTPEETTVANEVRPGSHDNGSNIAQQNAAKEKPSDPSQRATTMAEAAAAARSIAGRQDPMAPASNRWSGVQPAAVVFVPAPPATVPPPPGESTSLLGQYNRYFATLPHNRQQWQLPQQQEAIEQPEALPNNLSVDDVRLVGIVDGKAFFTMPKRLAKHLNLPKSFVLAAGQALDNVTVDSVSTDGATIHDGSKIATKELAPIR